MSSGAASAGARTVSVMFEARHVTISIDRPPADVYAYVSDPVRLPEWAAGLSGSIAHLDGKWVAASPMGRVTVEFAPPNLFGVLDHDVTLESGEVVHNPFRVLPNGDGSELVLTLLRREGMSAEEFDADEAAIRGDLETLRGILEAGS